MPHITVMIGADGPVIDLGVAVGRSWQRRLAAQGIVVPSATTVRALIDTGSDLSVVHPQVLHQLGVQATGSIRTIRCRQFGVGSSLLLPLHQVGKLDSWEDFQDRQAMTLFTTRSTAGTTEPMSSASTANGICSLAISPAPRHGTLSRSSATA